MNLKKEVEEAKEELAEVKQEGIAYLILTDYKKANKRLFIALIMVLIMWFLTIGYLVYILNDIGTIEETRTQEIDGTDIEYSDIINGDYYGED